MELINSVTGVDEEGRSRQRILSFAAKRYLLSVSDILYRILLATVSSLNLGLLLLLLL